MKKHRKRLLSVVFLAMSSCAWSASLDSQANDMFNSLGVIGNITPPTAFKGQTMNTYTGGSVFIRSPTKNYQLLSVSLPYIRAGCGGIDAFGGSFSHISSAQFKAMLTNITSAIPGVLFDMAIKSVSPLFAETINTFKGWEAELNKANINSCEAAKSLVSSAITSMGFSTAKACENLGQLPPFGLDVAASREKCGTSAGVSDVVSSASADDKKQLQFVGNLVWAALSKNSHLDQDDKHLIQSITGTTVYSMTLDGASEPTDYGPLITSVNDLLYGNTDPAGLPTGQVQVKIWKCGNSECTTLTQSVIQMQSLRARVSTIMQSLSDKIATGATEPTLAEKNFVNLMPVPVYKLLSAANTINNSAIASSKIEQYTDYMAIEFAYSLLSRLATMATTAHGISDKLTDPQRAKLTYLVATGRDFSKKLDAERQTAATKAQAFVNFAADIEQLQRSMRASQSQQISDLLGYARTSPIR